ncbi:hypothetical protein J728_3330 [Acinetobacter baumannii 1276470-132]|nr:hypothetical protein J728_3330 [Acinetobacter baumannii 1276470-132]
MVYVALQVLLCRASKDAILLENQDKRIFVYSTSKDCNEMLEVRNANAP